MNDGRRQLGVLGDNLGSFSSSRPPAGRVPIRLNSSSRGSAGANPAVITKALRGMGQRRAKKIAGLVYVIDNDPRNADIAECYGNSCLLEMI